MLQPLFFGLKMRMGTNLKFLHVETHGSASLFHCIPPCIDV